MPIVSVIVPVHNAEAYLKQCMDSILSQTLRDIEIICVENGSSDNSLSILKDYEALDKRVSVIKQEKSEGAGHARNTGMLRATGKYLSFLDADDYFDSVMLEQMVDKAEKCSADIVICDAFLLDYATGVIKSAGKLQQQYIPEKDIFSYKDIPDYIFQINTSAAWNKLFLHSFIIKSNLQFQCSNIIDDMYFVSMAMVKAERITIINERYVYYREGNPDSQLGQRTAHPDAFYYAALELKKQLETEGYYATVEKSYINDISEKALDYLYAMSDWQPLNNLYNNMRNYQFKELGICGQEKETFYNRQVYEQYKQIMQNSPEEWIYNKYSVLKKYSVIEEFPFPVDSIPKGSKIVLYGAGNAGKAYYFQAICSRYCQIVLWTDKEWETIGPPVSDVSKISDTSYDYILIAVLSVSAVNDIRKQLVKMGVSEKKIITITDTYLTDLKNDEVKQPKMSVLIPVYNAEPFLYQCLDSVIKQPMAELEIICINDGSTDNSPQILEEYMKKDGRIKVLHQDNQGYGIALNKGIEEATGEYIHFLDADDFLTDNAYEEVYKVAHENNIDYLKIKSYVIDFDSNEIMTGYYPDILAQKMMSPEDYKTPFSFIDAPEKLTLSPSYSPWSGIYLRSFVLEKKIKFSSIKGFPDHSFYYMVITRAMRIMVADVYVLYYRRNNPNSLVGNYIKRYADHFESFRIIYDDCCFLPPREYALILIRELDDIFYWYDKALNDDKYKDNAHKLIFDFVRNFDFSHVKDYCSDERWYPDYLQIKYEITKLNDSTNNQEEKAILNKWIAVTRNIYNLPIDKVQSGSRIVLYGAGYLGVKIYKMFQLSNFCDIVLFVDKNWKKSISCEFSINNPEDILNSTYDSILVTTKDIVITSEIVEWLINRNISKDKIISSIDR